MLPLRNTIQCLYFRVKDGAHLGVFPQDYDDAIPFSGVLETADGKLGTFGGFQARDYDYTVDTHDLKLNSRMMKTDDVIFVNVERDPYTNEPILNEDNKYRVISFKIGQPRVNFRDQKRNEEEAPKRLYVK